MDLTGSELSAEFHGPTTGIEPLTWGQHSVWNAYCTDREHTAGWNIGRVLTVPSRAVGDPAGVTRAVGILLSRHESLRTRVDLVDGWPRQIPSATGRLPVRVLELSGDVTAESTKDAMAGIPYEYPAEWPLRVTLLTERGRVTHVALVFSHMAVDFHASELVLRDLRLLLLRGSVSTAPGLQSLDVARRERGPWQHLSDDARDHWLKQYVRLPRTMFDETGPASTPRYPRALLVSRAVDSAMRVIAARQRVSTATVLLAATAALIGSWTGHDHCGLLTTVNNRHRPGYLDAVSKLAQFGLFAVELADRPSFAELVQRTWRAAMNAYRHAYYDPQVLNLALEGIGRHTSTSSGLEPRCCVNDLRERDPAGPVVPAPDEAMIRAALKDTELTWQHDIDPFTWRFRLQMVDVTAGIGLSLSADTRCLPADRIELFLRELEQLVVRAAFHDVPWPWTA